ncbi:MAG: response regulator [Patescibacteria group bacterium]
MATKVLLLVEDDPTLQRLYSRVFDEADFEVVVASDGVAIVEKASVESPDVILMDVMMPNRNGMEALGDLKDNEETKDIPVIMLSAHEDDQLLMQAMQMGAKRYLVKSRLDPDQVVSITREVLGENQVPGPS